MKTLRLSVFLSFAALALAGCGTAPSPGKCDAVKCSFGLNCDELDGLCKPVQGGGGGGGNTDGGSDAGASCLQTGCTGAAPICDAIAQVCRVCTPSQGCGGDTPLCDTNLEPRACVGCRDSDDCFAGSICSPLTRRCEAGNDGGVDTDGGSMPPDAGGGGVMDGGAAPDAGAGNGGYNGPGSCAPQDGGVVPCIMECERGFSCVNGQCVLNGGGGDVQVTLRWNSQEDLDLHVDEPLPGGGVCEIYYDDPNDTTNGLPSSCGAVGSLDLDSEAGCPSPPDYVDIENIIYPAGVAAPSGTYEVRVDHYANCNPSLSMVPFEVEVRNNGVISGMCGVFKPSDPDWDFAGSAGDGRVVMTFTVP